jgi:hypothetical protein
LCHTCQESLDVSHLPANGAGGPPVNFGILEAALTWASTTSATLLAPLLAGCLYLVVGGLAGWRIARGDALLAERPFLLMLCGFLLVSQLLTIGLAWFVVTDGLRLVLADAVGWTWTVRRRTVAAAAAGFVLLNLVAIAIFGEPESTPFQRMTADPLVSAFIGVLAVATAPLAEELVYRGLLFPALERRLGRVASILLVSGLFVFIHLEQYAASAAAVVTLGALSLTLTGLRAYTGSLLPSFALHTLYNGLLVGLATIGVLSGS